MPDTPIDLSEGIQSVRLKVPTAVVPIPPEGFAQLHSPAEGELALRLPDGSVVAVGGGGAAPTSLHNPYGSQVNLDGADPTIGVLLGIAPGQQWVIDPPVFPVDIARRPLGLQVTGWLPITSAEVLGLHTIPKTLVAAPDATHALLLSWLLLESLADGDPYIIADFTLDVLNLVSGPPFVGLSPTNLQDAGHDVVEAVAPWLQYAPAVQYGKLSASVMGKPLSLVAYSAITGGTSTFRARVGYFVV